MPYNASHRFAKISPKKVVPIMNLIRGLPVNEALEVLDVTHRRGASMVAKVVRSALANADQMGEQRLDHLVVADARVDQGPRIKRLRPRARGMAFLIRKRMSHLRITLDEPLN